MSVILAVGIALFPYREITRWYLRNKREVRIGNYKDDRALIPSEYDRLNPLTK